MLNSTLNENSLVKCLLVSTLSMVTILSIGCSRKQSLTEWMNPLTNSSAEAESEMASDFQPGLINWRTSFEKASAEANATDKTVMLWFTGSDWCKYCTMLDEEVFQTREFVEWADANVVPVMLDYPKRTSLPEDQEAHNKRVRDRYSKLVTSYPTALFVDSNGTVIGKMGYQRGGPTSWIAKANQYSPGSSTTPTGDRRPTSMADRKTPLQRR